VCSKDPKYLVSIKVIHPRFNGYKGGCDPKDEEEMGSLKNFLLQERSGTHMRKKIVTFVFFLKPYVM